MMANWAGGHDGAQRKRSKQGIPRDSGKAWRFRLTGLPWSVKW